MAKFNEILVGRYNRFLAKLFGMKTGGAVIPQLASEVQPVFPFFNGAENRYLEGWDRFVGGGTIGAVALNQSAYRLRNPTGSNVMAVVEKWAAVTSLGQILIFSGGTATADLAVVGTGSGLDPRGRKNSTCKITSQNNAAAAPGLTGAFTIDAPIVLASSPWNFVRFENQEIPLLPGSALQLVDNTVNADLNFSVMWRERALEDSEQA
jgi:hypothetical protein